MIDKTENPNFLNDFLDYSATILNKSPNTLKEYNYDISHFLKYIKYKFGMVSIKEIDEIRMIEVTDFTLKDLEKIQLEDIHSFLAYLKTNYRSKPATLARKTSSIRALFHYLCNKTKKIPVNPAQDLESPKLDRRLPKYLTLDQSKELLQVASNPIPSTHGNHDNSARNYAIITLFLNCGMRLSELVGINIKDIDFSNNKLNVIGKGNKERTIYLNKSCIQAIENYMKERPTDGVKYSSRDALFLSEQK